MVLQRAFCCCKLETGGMAIAILSGISSILTTVYFSLLLSYEVLEHYYHLEILTGIYVGLSIIHAISTVFVVIGLKQKNRNLVLPWLIITFIELIPLMPFAFLATIIAFPFVFPYYVWHCMFSLYRTMDPLNEKVTSFIKFFCPQQPDDQTAHHMYNNLQA